MILVRGACAQTVLDYHLDEGTNYEAAAFRLWISDRCSVPDGILVLVPGSNSDGRSEVNNEDWQHFAEETNLAMLACYFVDKPHEMPAIEYYVNAKNGSGDALLEAVTSFSKKLNQPNLNHLPLLMFGMSAGGQFNYEFANWRPDRVMAFVVNKGGVYYTALAPKATREIPGLFITGEKDILYRTNIVKGIFSINRRFGARWTYAHDPVNGHVLGASPSLSRSFFREILKQHHLQGTNSDFASVGLNEASQLSDAPYDDSVITSWMVSEAFAQQWVQFVSGPDGPSSNSER